MPSSLKFSDALFPGMFVVASLLLILSSVRVPVIGAGWAELPANVLPMDMVQPLRQHLRPGDRIYNDANFGGFLIYHFPDARIFMDDRFELSGDDWLSQYVETIDQHPERLENWFQTYQFRLALVASSNPPLPLETAMLASGNWSIRARGHNSLLMERVESKLK